MIDDILLMLGNFPQELQPLAYIFAFVLVIFFFYNLFVLFGKILGVKK